MLFFILASLAMAGGPKAKIHISVTVKNPTCFSPDLQGEHGKPGLTDWIKTSGTDPLVGLIAPNVWRVDISLAGCQFVVSSIPTGGSWVPSSRAWTIHYQSGPVVIEEGRDYRIVISETTVKERICLSAQF